jgi:ABC-2 type transport system ATP-binding protein
MAETIEIDSVSYVYPRSSSGVADISLSVGPGTIYGLLGENGAGKTTLMRLMIGLIRPDSGSVRCFGHDLRERRRETLAAIGSLIEMPSLYAHLTAREHLRVFAAYTGAAPEAVERALVLTGIADIANRVVRRFSLGMKQRLALATALLHDPPVLILDEPTNGLDPSGIASMRDLVRRLASEFGKTVIVSSHLLAEVEKTATRIGILHRGRMHFEGTAEDLSRRLGPRSGLLLRTASPEAAANSLRLAGLACRTDPTGLIVEAAGDADAATAIRTLSGAGIDIYEATREAASLEQDYLSLITGAGADAR